MVVQLGLVVGVRRKEMAGWFWEVPEDYRDGHPATRGTLGLIIYLFLYIIWHKRT